MKDMQDTLYFTLYCFAKFFNISYSGPSSKLIDLFGSGITYRALEKVVSGDTAPSNYISSINTRSDQAKRLITTLSVEKIKNIYEKILETSPDDLATSEMIFELLQYALRIDKDIQKRIYERRNDDVNEWILTLQHSFQNTPKKNSNRKIIDNKPTVKSITLEESYTERKQAIQNARGTIYIAGSTLKDAFSTDAQNEKISIIQPLLNADVETINIFLLNYVYLNINASDGNQDGSAEIVNSIKNFLGRLKWMRKTPPHINIVLLSDLHIPFIFLTSESLITRSLHFFTQKRDFKGQYLVYNTRSDEYHVVKHYFDYLLENSYEIDLNSKKNSNYSVKDDFQIPKIKKFVSFKKVHPVQLYNLAKETFYNINNDELVEDVIDSYLNPDETQKVLLPYLTATKELFTQIVLQHDKNGYVDIIPSIDLGMPNNISRIAGGFLTGALYDWKCSVPIIPVDATVNTCTSSVFSLSDFDETISNEQFRLFMETLNQKANQNGYALNFLSGNHFLTVAKDDGNNYFLVMHSSAKECKESCFGLYPSPRSWFRDYIKTYINKEQNRYFRYIRGDAAIRFVDYANRFSDYNEEIHLFIAETFAEIFNISLTNETKIMRHHYGMPTKNSIVIGTFPVDINSEDRRVPIFSDYGKDMCLFDVSHKQKKLHRLIGTYSDIVMVPHGFGQVIDGLTSLSIKNILDEDARVLEVCHAGLVTSYSTGSSERINMLEKHIRNCSNVSEFINNNKQYVNGNIYKILHPLFCYCRFSFSEELPQFKITK